jgi:hypothetical protein
LGAAVVSAVLAWGSLPASAQRSVPNTKLVGTGAVVSAQQGSAVALSADGNTAIVGGAIADYL